MRTGFFIDATELLQFRRFLFIMDTLLLFDRKNPVSAACSLFCVNRNSKLSYLRSKIENEIQDLMLKEFAFVESQGEEDNQYLFPKPRKKS